MYPARTILHVDMDAFYAAVEQRDDPSLRGRPVIVGGSRERGVVSTASYEARVFGVRSAMPMAVAIRKCPQAIVVPGRHAHYAEVSRQVFAIFHRFTPLVEAISLDEAFLDVTGSHQLYGSGETIAQRIKDAIRGELSLTASAGVAPSKFVAKIASDLRKPDGLVIVAADDVRTFLAPLPVERMWGLGAKGAAHARAHGITTLGDLARTSRSELETLFGRVGPSLGDRARGEDDRDVVPDREAKSIGSEETFEHDLDASALPPRLLAHSMRVAERLHANGLVGRTVTVKVKHADFTLKTRAVTLDESAADTDAIYAAARAAFERFDLRGVKVRLVGVQMSGLEESGGTRSLFVDEAREKQKKLEDVAATLRDRFGRGAITRATLLDAERRKGK